MQKIEIIKHILRHVDYGHLSNDEGAAWASSNVALCKYWGKRDLDLNLPVTSSLSISHGNKGAFTRVKHSLNSNDDKYFLNGMVIGQETKFAKRLKEFLNLFRPQEVPYLVEIETNVPIAAGFASSACGFASLVQALDQLYNWCLSKKDLSILARLGSGSACRSLFDGFVEWQCGDSPDGMDSYAVKLEHVWPELRLGMLVTSVAEKPISSRKAMQLTVETSPAYASWPEKVALDLAQIKLALNRQDFHLLGSTSESNAISMHTTMWAAKPPIVYSLPETFAAITKVQELRLSGVPVYFTQDAGPNLQLLFLLEDEKRIRHVFPELEVVAPFVGSEGVQVTLVNEQDEAIGSSEKLATHFQGKLHRAFSVVIVRKRGESLEVLLQKRSNTKYHSAGLWSNACCGHPQPDEDIVVAAVRRLQEEMGISVSLKAIGKFHYLAKLSNVGLIENEIDHVLVGCSDLEVIPFNSDEVQSYRWLPIPELLLDLKQRPDLYTVWLSQVMNLVHNEQMDKK